MGNPHIGTSRRSLSGSVKEREYLKRSNLFTYTVVHNHAKLRILLFGEIDDVESIKETTDD